MNMIKQLSQRINYQICILILAFLALFGSTMINLINDWYNNENYSHGFLVPLITAYMIWQKKHLIAKHDLHPNNIGLFVLILGLLIFIVGNVGAELFTMRTAMVITLVGLCIYSFGIHIVMIIGIPIIYLMFMIPLPAIIWNEIAFPLQLFASKLTAEIIQIMGMPVLREGNVLHLSNTTLEVVDACSGIRSLMSLLALSAAFAYLVKLKKLNKWILFLAAIPIAIIVNIIRLIATALLARYIGPNVAQGFLHDLSGIIIFIAAFIILYALFAVLNKSEKKLKLA